MNLVVGSRERDARAGRDGHGNGLIPALQWDQPRDLPQWRRPRAPAAWRLRGAASCSHRCGATTNSVVWRINIRTTRFDHLVLLTFRTKGSFTCKGSFHPFARRTHCTTRRFLIVSNNIQQITHTWTSTYIEYCTVRVLEFHWPLLRCTSTYFVLSKVSSQGRS